jgi:hypothetical protein
MALAQDGMKKKLTAHQAFVMGASLVRGDRNLAGPALHGYNRV